MHNAFYHSLEAIQEDDVIALRECIARLTYNAQGLIPVVTQCQQTKQVLMQAWMNQQAIEKTLATKRMIYWSRSRNSFWVKGETSGHIQKLINMRFDCDGDSVLCLVEQVGSACHTGRCSCFYLQVDIASTRVTLKQTPE